MGYAVSRFTVGKTGYLIVARFNLTSAIAICGRLGVPSKIPGFAWGLSAKRCILGSQLRAIRGTVCSTCYALRGNYTFAPVQRGLERRYRALSHPSWCDAMIFMINYRADQGHEYFRWFDSGDVQSTEHAVMIAKVARGTPVVRHWIASKEWKVWFAYRKHHKVPRNMIVRLSAVNVDQGIVCTDPFPAASVSSRVDHYDRAWQCRSKQQGNRCADCRACWDPAVRHVNYVKH